MRIIGVIEARMGSTRFPGKVLAELAGRPILWHIVQRLRHCHVLERLVLATSVEPANDILAAYASELGLVVVRGPEDSLLDRHLIAASAFKPDIIVRITGDCPLVDPGIVDRLVEQMVVTGAAYATVRPGSPCIHEGIDPFTTDVLLRLATEVGHEPSVREHVVSYLKTHPDFAPITYIELDKDEEFAGARISVDTPADLQFLETVYQRIGAPPGEADIRAVVRMLRENPSLLDINRHIHQKVMGDRTLLALFLCENADDAALLSTLAAAMRDEHGVGITFRVAEDCRNNPSMLTFHCISLPYLVFGHIVLPVHCQVCVRLSLYLLLPRKSFYLSKLCLGWQIYLLLNQPVQLLPFYQ